MFAPMQARQDATSPAVESAWRFLLLNWTVIGAMGAVLVLGFAFTGFSLTWPSLMITVGYVAIYAGFAHANARSPKRRDPQVMFVLGATAQIVLITAIMTPLTYVAASAGFPLQDANLLAIDRALGVDWPSYVAFINDHPALAGWLHVGYAMIRWPIFAIPVILAAKRDYRRIEEFTFAFGAALFVTTVISAFVPALGIYAKLPDVAAVYPHVVPLAYFDSLRELPLVREGALRQLDLLKMSGLVTFPSFHAASAALYTWALWRARWIRPIAVIANGLMLASCPVFGAHYVIDIIAGVAIALLAIIAARRIGEGCERQHALRIAAVPISAAAVAAE
jgi:hypothetical protein